MLKKPRYIFGIMALLILLVSFFPHMVSAGEDGDGDALFLTLSDAQAMAMAYTRQIEKLDKTIDDLWTQHNELKELSRAKQAQLDMLDDFEKLYEKKSGVLDELEQRQLTMYLMIFGPVPPRLSPAEIFNNYVKDRDFPYYSVWAAYKNTIAARELARASVALSVRQLFDSLAGLQDALSLQQKLYEDMAAQHGQLVVRYEKGLVSELDKYVSEVELEKQKTALKQLERTIDTAEMALKRQIGIPLTQEIRIDASYNSSKWISLLPYKRYLERALQERTEIATAKMDLHVKQRELDIMKEYLKNELLTERLLAQQAVDEKTIALDRAIEDVTKDIHAGYADVSSKRKDIYIAARNLEYAKKQHKQAIQLYEEGMVSLARLRSAQAGVTQAEIAYNKAVRDFNNALHRLETASGIGPGYTSGMGGI